MSKTVFYYYDRYDPKNIPKIVVEPPGPKSREIIERDHELLMQSFVRWYPLVAKSGYGVVIEDFDGNLFVDLNSGIAVMNVGHSHPRIVKVVEEQVRKLIHYSLTDFYYEEVVEYSESLSKILPIPGKKKFFFGNSGAEAIEAAMKISKGVAGGKRPYIMAFIGSFHGRTHGAMSLTASKPAQRKGFQPLLPGIIHVPYPYPYRCPFHADPEECGDAVIGFIEEWIFRRMVDPSEISAVFIEPIQGEGGYVVPPDDFLPKLRKLTRENGILLVADEVQSGFGRTGKWFAVENWGVDPDLITMAKAVASGIPLGVVGGREEVMNLPPGSHASTFGGNPVALKAGTEVIRIIKDEKLLENAEKVGNYVMKRAREWMDSYEIVGDVRGKGLMIGIELVRNRKTKEYARKELESFLIKCFKRGVAVIGAGFSAIRIAPPLVISQEIMERSMDIMEEVLKEVVREHSSA
ncbi:MAG: acetyl ornithine aminotransferase family protein [Desulfurococcaceae archaeon]|nr:acetyl ornithine aminotransferase family protein [Desulfurococcaceae archaeon]